MTPVCRSVGATDMLDTRQVFIRKKQWKRPASCGCGRQSNTPPPPPPEVVMRAQRRTASVGFAPGCHQGKLMGEGTQPRLAGKWREYMQQGCRCGFRQHTKKKKKAQHNNPGMSRFDGGDRRRTGTSKTMREYLAGM